MNLKALVEVLLFASPKPLTQSRFLQVVENKYSTDLMPIINELNSEYERDEKGLVIKNIGGGYQILTRSKYHIFIERLFDTSRKFMLSKQALEALSIIAYRQPVSKAEVESIRGVECGSVLKTLIEWELILVKGRGKSIGRPLLFGTTTQFLEAFGLEKTTDLPKLNELSELMGDNPEHAPYKRDHASK